MDGGSRTATERVRREGVSAAQRAPAAMRVVPKAAAAPTQDEPQGESAAPETSPATPSATAPAAVPAPARAATPDAATSDRERRAGQRRAPVLSRNPAQDRTKLAQREFFPRQWPFLILTMAAATIAALWVSGSLPQRGPAIMLGLAFALALPVSLVWDFVSARGMAARLLATALVVIAPLYLFGLGMTEWARGEGVGWDVTIATLISVSSVAMVYLRRQPGMIFAAQLAIWTAIVSASGSLVGILGVGTGAIVSALVTREQMRLQKAEEEQRRVQERIATRAQDILTDYEQTGQGWFWETDRRSVLTYVSPPVAEALGRQPEQLLGQSLTRLFNLVASGDEGERTLMFHLSARSAFSELAMRAAIPGDERWWSVSGRPLYDQFDNFVGFRGSGTDLTERKRSQESAARLARYDSLTGLANRFQMNQVLEKILGAQQETGRHCAVLLLDLDRFKQVNDTMGHPAGDALLQQVAQRLERAVGKMGQVGRLGGDEFQVVVPNRVPRESLAELGQEIIASVSQPYSIEGQRVVIGVSVGIAQCPHDGKTSEALIRNADLALYAAKDGGRGRYHFYSNDLHAQAEARSQMEEDLRDALAKGELQMFYQPVVSLATETIAGFEALMRWQHPVKGSISPQRFIESAEDSGMIQQLGEWALRQACSDLATWPDEVRVAVNVSPLQFANPQFPSVVANALAHAGVRASRLELEITETVFLSDDAGTDAMFASLKKLGVRLALDDFGTGYSSLGYLKKAPFDKIKIDQSFVRGATEQGSHNGAIIASITSLALALGMETTAEGVETLDELDLVRMHGCTHVQGFIYERPLAAAQASERLATGLHAVARGPRSARAPRQTMLRKVVLDHNGHLYNATIRNISSTGALIEGLWNVPLGTIFRVLISQSHAVTCTTRWSEDDRMGVEFANALQRDGSGRIAAIQGAALAPLSDSAKQAAG